MYRPFHVTTLNSIPMVYPLCSNVVPFRIVDFNPMLPSSIINEKQWTPVLNGWYSFVPDGVGVKMW